ncbi:zinc ribbon domain-containing protein [candidate division WOR-3 bacterium]|nr:zinc ribbon domain-containing protein [candidate division WOR-3 bacterium]
MKYCPTCGRWNQGSPVFCQYCGHTWNYRVCPRGHLNPPNARFCQECGSPDLSEPAEGRVPIFFRLIKPLFWIFVISIGLLVFISFIKSVSNTTSLSFQSFIPSLIPIGLLLLVIFLIPGTIGRGIRRIIFGLIKLGLKTVIGIVSGTLRFLFGIGKRNKSRG